MIMFAQERFQKISDLLAKEKRLTVRDLQRILKTSSATLRRDLSEMEKAELVFRVHGGVVHPKLFQGEPSFSQKKEAFIEKKRAIASRAADLITKPCTIFIDSGTTCHEVARRLLPRSDLQIITNSISILQMGSSSGAKLVGIGGEVRPVSQALVGSLSLSWVEHLRADWAFIGASGLSEEGASTTEMGEASIKQAFCNRATKKVLVADGKKWDKSVPVLFAKWSRFDYWVTTEDVPVLSRRKVQSKGPEVICCKE
jgi:DeoR family transcriptional regulator, fructose operon transcriptional repressor